MTRVSLFPHFAAKENHATNNTLLALRHFYQSSPHKIQGVLTSLLENEPSIGLAFEQQRKEESSVPDALISQEPLRIFIETKRTGVIDLEQIRRHLKGIASKKGSSSGGNTLIALTKEPIAEHDRKSLAANAAKQQITFAAVTFSQIVDALKVQCADFERELLAVIEDYEGYLAEAGLLEERNQWLIVPPCGTSIDDVSRFGLYYEPSSRPCKRNYRFIGLYTQKTIRYVGTVEAIAVEYYSKGRYTFTEEVGLLTDDHKKRIKSVIDATDYYDLKANPHRFYLVDSFVQTNARKTSYGGIMGLRYLDLEEMLKDKAYSPQKDYTSKELAAALEGATWE